MFKSSSQKQQNRQQATTESQNQVAESPQDLVGESPTFNFTTAAFSIVKNGNSWVTVEIPLDPVTQQTGEWIIHSEDGSKMAAQERFKINVAKKLFM